jgi:hypothetical protein
LGILVANKDSAPRRGRAHLEERVCFMHLLEASVVISVVLSAAGLIAALSAAVVAADKLVGAWYYSEPKARGRKARGNRCTGSGRRLQSSRDCPVSARRRH